MASVIPKVLTSHPMAFSGRRQATSTPSVGNDNPMSKALHALGSARSRMERSRIMFITSRLIESVQMLQAAQEVQRPNRLGTSISRDDPPLTKMRNMVELL